MQKNSPMCDLEHVEMHQEHTPSEMEYQGINGGQGSKKFTRYIPKMCRWFENEESIGSQ